MPLILTWTKAEHQLPAVLDGHTSRCIVTVESKDGKRFIHEAEYANWLKLDWWEGNWSDLPNGLVIQANGTDSVNVKGWLIDNEDDDDIRYGPVMLKVIAWVPYPTPFRE